MLDLEYVHGYRCAYRGEGHASVACLSFQLVTTGMEDAMDIKAVHMCTYVHSIDGVEFAIAILYIHIAASRLPNSFLHSCIHIHSCTYKDTSISAHTCTYSMHPIYCR